jgi:hypothetical protein
VLVVEACEGESIGHVELPTTDHNLQIKAIAILPADL